jgi:hypothetical protein
MKGVLVQRGQIKAVLVQFWYSFGTETALTMGMERKRILKTKELLAGTTGLEPATSCVTGMRSNQLNYVPDRRAEKPRNA